MSHAGSTCTVRGTYLAEVSKGQAYMGTLDSLLGGAGLLPKPYRGSMCGYGIPLCISRQTTRINYSHSLIDVISRKKLSTDSSSAAPNAA